MTTLSGKIVVVVGGTSGIGFGVAKGSLLSLAAHVVVASSTKSKVDSAVGALQKLITDNTLPGKVSGQVLDGNDIEEVKKFIEALGEIDHLVWTSGTPPGKAEMTIEQIQDAMKLRLWSPVAAAKAAKIRSGGSIVFTNGLAVFKPPRGWSLPVTVGGAVDAATRGLAIDLAPVRVNVVSPGLVDTEFRAGMPKEHKEALLKQVSAMLPVKHVAGADEVAEAYLFVMKCNYVTGQTIHVEGGHLLI